jgi:hypothetical protein
LTAPLNCRALAHTFASRCCDKVKENLTHNYTGVDAVNNPDLFWFRTRQGLLEEWGYIPGAWHLIRRSKISITVLGVSAQGRPVISPGGAVSELHATRVTLALIDGAQSELIGPYSAENLPVPPGFSKRALSYST